MDSTWVTSADTSDRNGDPWDCGGRTHAGGANDNTNTSGDDVDRGDVTGTMTVSGGTQQLDFAKCTGVGACSADEPNKIDWTVICRGGVTRT